MAPPARVRARVRPWLLSEKAMEGFRDAFDHPHELVVRGGRDRALCHKVANGRRGVAETKRKCHRGAPCGVFRRVGEAAWVLPGGRGPREALGWCSSLLQLKSMEGRGWMATWLNANSPPVMSMKSRSPKHTCVPRTQLIAWLAI